MKWKLALMMIALMPLVFAAWQSLAGMAIMISIGILAILFMVGMGFQVRELQMMAKEELYQVIAAAFLVILLIGSDGILNLISQNAAFTGGQDSLQDNAIASIENTIGILGSYFEGLITIDNWISEQSSKTFRCSIMMVGYTVSGCGGYSMINPPVSMAGSIIGFALGELAAVGNLIELTSNYAMVLLLPAGIILRTLKVTRGAGGLLIAFAISAHIMLPLGIIFVDMMAENFISYDDDLSWVDSSVLNITDYTNSDGEIAESLSSVNDDYDCEPENTGSLGEGPELNNEQRAKRAYDQLRGDMKKYVFVVLVKATLGPIIAILMFIGSLRALTSLAGAEVDVTGLAKVI
jgi:hypothetical protein